MVKYLIDSDDDLPCSTKRTPIIDMVHNTMADMANADYVRNRWLNALCPIIVVLSDVNSQLFYKRKVVYLSMTTGDDFDVLCVCVCVCVCVC